MYRGVWGEGVHGWVCTCRCVGVCGWKECRGGCVYVGVLCVGVYVGGVTWTDGWWMEVCGIQLMSYISSQ